MLKRIAIILGSVLILLLFVVFFSTSFVERESYFNDDYYKKTEAVIDSMKPVLETGSLQAGFAKVSITPTLNSKEDNFEEGKFVEMPLSGYGGREGKPATGIHDSIFLKAAAVKVGSQTAVFVGADLLIMPPNVVDSVTVLLNAKGIRRDQVFYSATHTHSSLGAWGPGKLGEQFSGKENANVERWLTQQIVEVVVSAVADLKPAKISTGNYNIPKYTRNRLIGKTGVKNNDFSYIVLEQAGHKKAIIGSYSAHATSLGENMEISADYPGYWQRKMEATSFDYAVFFAGSVGSQSHAGGEGEKFDKPKFIGESLADSLRAPLSKLVFTDTIAFSSISLKMNLPEFHIRLTPEINLATALSEKVLPFKGDIYLQAVRLGNMIWITTPCDFSGEFALQLKNSLAAYGFNANVSSFNGGYVGYIVPGRYFYLDEYEPKSMGWFGPNMGEYTMDMIRQITRVITGKDNI
jgi:neutral ceramidase